MLVLRKLCLSLLVFSTIELLASSTFPQSPTDNSFDILLYDNNNDGNWDPAEPFTDSLLFNNLWDEGEEFVDEGNGVYDYGESFIDEGNGVWDEGEPFVDSLNGVYDEGEEFVDSDSINGKWDDGELFIDLGIMNGLWDEGEEFVDEGNGVYDYGSLEPYADAGNGLYDEGETFTDNNNNGVWDYGWAIYSKVLPEDYDEDGNVVLYITDEVYAEFPSIQSLDLISAGYSLDWVDLNPEEFVDEGNGAYDIGEAFDDINGNGLRDVYGAEPFVDSLNGIWDPGEAYLDGNNYEWDEGEYFVDSLNGVYDEGEVFTDLGNGAYDEDEEFTDLGNGTYDEGEVFTDALNGVYDLGEPFVDAGSGAYELGEPYVDINSNAQWDPGEPYTDTLNGFYDPGETFTDYLNGVWDPGEEFIDAGNGVWDEGEPFVDAGNGVWDEGEPFVDSLNGVYDEGEIFLDYGNGVWDEGEPFVDSLNGVYDEGEEFTDLGNGVYDEGEEFTDVDSRNGVWDEGEPFLDLPQMNGVWDEGEPFVDSLNGVYDEGEEFTDLGNGVYDLGEYFVDEGNGIYDEGELFTDVDSRNGIYDLGEAFDDINGNGIWDPEDTFIDANGNGVYDEPNIIFVDSDAAEGGNGSSWQNAYKYLDDALVSIGSHKKEIWLAGGTYYPGDNQYGNTRGNVGAVFNIIWGSEPTNITIRGGFSGNETSPSQRLNKDNNVTILSGKVGAQWADNLFTINIRNNQSSLLFDSLTVEGTTQSIFTNTGWVFNLDATDCLFSDHSAGSGRSVFEYLVGTSNFLRCIFANNANQYTSYNIEYNSSSYSYLRGKYDLTTTLFSTTSNIKSFYSCVFYNNQSLWGPVIAYEASLKAINCLFYNNLSNGPDALFSNMDQLEISNSTLFSNSSSDKLFSKNNEDSEAIITNSILFNNSYFNFSDFKNHYDIIESSSTQMSNNFIDTLSGEYLIDPEIGELNFANIENPIGEDGKWMTEDDGLKLLSGSIAIAQGNKALLPSDSLDLDSDGDVFEKIPLDFAGIPRLQAGNLDLGAYAFDQELPYRLNLTSNLGGSVNLPKFSYYASGDVVTITATPSAGYVFSDLSGDLDSQLSSVDLTMDSDKVVVANFLPDISDSDEDGLSNYEEIVSIGTNHLSADTSGDGFNDKLLYDLNMDPRTDYSILKSSYEDGYSLEEIKDLRPGSVTIQVVDGEANINMDIESSTDLENWEIDSAITVPMQIEEGEVTKFFRFKMAE